MAKDEEFSKKDIRKIARRIPNCTEIPNKHNQNVISFLLATEPNPARIQIYCDTRTVIALRVFDGSARHIFKTNCSLKEVERILNEPPELSLLDLDKLPYDDASSKGIQEPMSDEYLLDVGETILAAESEALKAHYNSLKVRKETIVPDVEYACSFPGHVMNQVESIIHNSSNRKQRMICAATDGQSAVFVYQNGLWRGTKEVPSGLMANLMRHSSPPTYVSLGSKGRFYASFEDGKKIWEGPQSMDMFFLKKPVRCIAFGRTLHDFVVVYNDGTWKHSGNMPNDLYKLLHPSNGHAPMTNVSCITTGANGEYFMTDTSGHMWWGGLSDVVQDVVDGILDDGYEIEFIDFGSLQDSYFITYKC